MRECKHRDVFTLERTRVSCEKFALIPRSSTSIVRRRWIRMEVVSNEVNVRTGSESMPCHVAHPATGGPYPALVVVMEAFGLNTHIKSITDRFAAEGFAAIAPNLYFRQDNNVVGYHA